MAKKSTPTNIVINNVDVRPIVRQNIDIAKWRQALKSAESPSANRKQLYDIYAEILLDAKLSSFVEKRLNAAVNIDIKFFDQNNEANEELDTLIEKSYFRTLLKEILLAKFFGQSLIEIDFNPAPDYPNALYSVPREHVKPEFGVIVRNAGDTNGLPYAELPNLLYCGDGKLGILNQACAPVIYKRSNTADWAEFNEVFGKPYPHGTYENDPSRALLTESFTKAGFDAFIVAPKDTTVDFKLGNFTGSFPFQYLKEVMDEELAILILGQNLTSSVDQGSFAAAQVHEGVEASINDADHDFIISILNEKLIPILLANGFKADGKFRYVYTDGLSLKDRIVIDTQVASIVPVDADYFYETYRIPKPLNSQASTADTSTTDNTTAQDKAKPKDKPKDKKQGLRKQLHKTSGFLDKLRGFFFSKAPSFEVLVNKQYTPICDQCNTLAKGDAAVLIDRSIIDKALENIYAQNFDLLQQIEPSLWKAIYELLNKTVDQAFGKVIFGEPDFDFVNQLKYNNAVYSAFKVHREQNDIALKLLDDKGNLKSFETFKRDAAPIDAQYTKWLDVEYNTAVIRARTASNFKKFERDADIYPNLKWLPSTSIERRPAHIPYYGKVHPINSDFWRTNFPGNEYGCKCGLTNTDEDTDKLGDISAYTPAPGLDGNPADTAKLFGDTNPYLQHGYLSPKKLKKVAKREVDKLIE